MKIDIMELTIKVTRSELKDIFGSLMMNVQTNIENHWVSHPNAFEEGETRLRLIQTICPFVERDYDVISQEFLDLIDKRMRSQS